VLGLFDVECGRARRNALFGSMDYGFRDWARVHVAAMHSPPPQGRLLLIMLNGTGCGMNQANTSIECDVCRRVLQDLTACSVQVIY
jgi:hypothetical protein